MAEQTSTRSSRWRLLGLLLAAIVALLAVVAVGAFFFLPSLARPLAERAASAALGVPVSIGRLGWEPLSRRVTAEQVRIGEENDALSVRRVSADVQLERAWRGEIGLDRVEVEAPVGVVALDASYRPLLFPDDDGAADAVQPDVKIGQIALRDAELTIRYPVRGQRRDAQLRVANLVASDVSLTADGAWLQAEINGSLDGAPLNAVLRAAGGDVYAAGDVTGLVLARGAVDLPAALETFRATVDAKFVYDAGVNPPRRTLQVDARLAEPGLTDRAGVDYTAKAIAVPDLRIDLATGAVVVDQVRIDAPVGALALDAQYQPVLPAFGPEAAAPPAADAPPITVRAVVAADGELTLRYLVAGKTRDVPLQLTTLALSDIAMVAGGIALSGELSGTLDGAPVAGTVKVAEAGAVVDADLRVTGWSVNRGTMDLPPGLESFATRLDLRAIYEQRAAPPRAALRLDARLVKPRVQGTDATEISAKSVEMPQVRIDLTTQAIALGAVVVDSPALSLTLTPDGIVLPLPAAGSGASGDRAWTITPGGVELRNGQVQLRRGTTMLPVTLTSARWGNAAGADPAPLAIQATVPGGGRIAVSGTLDSAPLAAELDVGLTQVPLPALAELADVLPLQLTRGTGDGTLQVHQRDGRWRVEGDVRVRDLHTAPPVAARPTEVLAVSDASAALVLDSGGTPQVDIASLKLSYPYVMVLRHGGGIFPADLFRRAAPGGAPPATPPSVRVRSATIEEGKLEFVDTTLEPDYWTSLSHLRAEASEVRLPAATVERFAIAGRQDELSPIEIAGALTARGLEAQAAVQDVLLQSLNPYVAPLLGYDVTGGRLTVNIDAVPKPPYLAATARVVVRGADVEQTGVDVIQQQSGVPLPIALSLISNRSGEIDLTLPVTMDTSGRLALGSVVGQAVRSAIVTALTSPLRILGNLFGSKGAPHAFAVDPIPFAAGSDSLDAAGEARIAEIARIVHAHIGLVLVAMPQIAAADRAVVDSEDLQALADERGAAVRTALTDADPPLPAERIMLVPWQPPAEGAAPADPGVYVELQDQP